MESAKAEENSHHAWGVRMVCEFRTPFAQLRGCASFAHHSHGWGGVRVSHKPGAVVFRRPYLPHFSSKSYTVWSVGFLTYWALKWYIACRKMDFRKCSKSAKEYCIYCPLCFSSLCLLFLFASLLYLACLNDPKGCQNTKTSHKYD